MGRPTVSAHNKRIAVAIAEMVTVKTDDPEHRIARSGVCSIFALLRAACPELIRERDFGPRDGISEAELNKALLASYILEFGKTHFWWLNFGHNFHSGAQAEGFVRIRNRRVDASSRELDPVGAGLYLFRFFYKLIPQPATICSILDITRHPGVIVR